MKKIISLVLFSSFVGFSHAGTNISEQLAQCQKVTGDSERLQCFDKLGKLKAEDKTESSEPQSAGKWETRSEKSPIDDSSNEFVYLSAENQIRGQFGGSITPFLFITCREKKTELFINWETFLGIDGTRVLTRIDSQKAVNRTWQISTDNKATFYSGQTISLIKELMKSKKMFVQITPYGENPAQATFDLSGLSTAIKPLREACKW
ncbi:type VI secretion protein [Serratia nevei]|nr:type VI secretion protein [Serratia nevei]